MPNSWLKRVIFIYFVFFQDKNSFYICDSLKFKGFSLLQTPYSQTKRNVIFLLLYAKLQKNIGHTYT